MLGNILPPYHSLQELNLDWILTKVKDMLRFLPDDGSVGQILRRTAHGAEWSNEQGGGGAVSSVNGQTGDVVLTADDVGALADTTPIPTQTSDLINDSGFVDAAGAAAAAPVQSVNGQTGAVSLTIPDSTSDLVNDSGFVDAAGAAAAAPVQSVNGQTGAVTIPSASPLDAYPVGSIYMSVNNTSPAVLFGGTWQQIKDTFLLACGDTYSNGDTGGEAEHTLTVNEIPSHDHYWPSRSSANVGAYTWNTPWISNSGTGQSQAHTNTTGGGLAHNNMPPYLAVYVWQRTA